ncbi:unnamed protein product [Brassicogethes aeneus]|uniref:K Homology domain-containing protein n=1 Tax=Brassicogethes aeneus TaxID=1431903 RepID=A0A9P0AZP5_BRAAE|nr:unnamed protein product [Brassicogethes aeneus]
MKREADGDMGSPQKRTRRGDEEVRLLIPSKVAGSIIGKGGQNITKLRSQHADTLLRLGNRLQHHQRRRSQPRREWSKSEQWKRIGSTYDDTSESSWLRHRKSWSQNQGNSRENWGPY